MKTTEDIKNRINKHKDDPFGDVFGAFDSIEYLSFEEAKEFLKPEVTKEEWEQTPLVREEIIAKMIKYMEFALSKADGHRGISSGRSVEHFINWLWLLDDTETLAFAQDDSNYTNYGCPILKKICEKYGIEYPKDEGMQRMAKGLKCSDDCESGCG
jgi:hypothetical protein